MLILQLCLFLGQGEIDKVINYLLSQHVRLVNFSEMYKLRQRCDSTCALCALILFHAGSYTKSRCHTLILKIIFIESPALYSYKLCCLEVCFFLNKNNNDNNSFCTMSGNLQISKKKRVLAFRQGIAWWDIAITHIGQNELLWQ